MIDRQLELGLFQAPGVRVGHRNHRRTSRARWWFDRMHQVVSCARDWAPAPPARPEQRYLRLSDRHQS